MLVSSIETADIDLFPLNGDVVSFEDGLDGLCDFQTDTITYNSNHESAPTQAKNCIHTWQQPSMLSKVSLSRANCSVPGIKVAVYLPPYLVGLKMSDCTVAMPAHELKLAGAPE